GGNLLRDGQGSAEDAGRSRHRRRPGQGVVRGVGRAGAVRRTTGTGARVQRLRPRCGQGGRGTRGALCRPGCRGGGEAEAAFGLMPLRHEGQSHTAVTKLSITRFWPALSKSMVSLLPSMAALLPLPNFWWNTRSPTLK